jgi:hypothetical protein
MLKKIMLSQQALFIIFFAKPCRRQPTLLTVVCKHEFIFMPSHSVRSKAEPIGNKVATQSFYFFDYETLKCFLKINP